MRKVKNYLYGTMLAAGLVLAGASVPAMAANENGWQGNNADGWYYYERGEKVTGWQEIRGVWYWFDKKGLMAQDELVYIAGETYYFNPVGAMATGWYEFDRDSDVIYNYDLDIDEAVMDIQNPVFKDAEDAYETVWMYFHDDGTAADDEWYQSDVSGLWYYMDNLIMVAGDFDHIIGDYRYGFDENGAMLVGWNYNYNNQSLLAPNKSSTTWYYYERSGKKFDVDSEPNRFGWKMIDGEWYCFKSELNLASGNSVGTLIVDTFFNNGVTADTETNFYYVDKDGVMADGATKISKDSGFVQNSADWGGGLKVGDLSDSAIEVYFNRNGIAVADTFDGDRYYAAAGAANVKAYDTETFAVTGYPVDFEASLVKNCFVTKDKNTYYMDKYGDKVISSALQIGYVKVTDTAGVLSYEFSVTATGAENEYKTYLVLDNKGAAWDDVEEGRTARAGAKSYVSTGVGYETVGGVECATIFYYNK